MKEALLRGREGSGGTPRPVPRADPARDGRPPALRGAGHADRRAGGRHAARGGRPPAAGLKRKGDGGRDRRSGPSFVRRGPGARLHGGRGRASSGQTMEKFSSYSFNKAHSASYAAMAYQAVYLKAHHPVPYIAAVLNAGGGYYELAEYVEEAKRLGIRILGPDVNRSGARLRGRGGGHPRRLHRRSRGWACEDGRTDPRGADGRRATSPRSRTSWPGVRPVQGRALRPGQGRRLRLARSPADAAGPALRPGDRGRGADVRPRRPGEGQDAPRVARASAPRPIRSPSTRASGPTCGSRTSAGTPAARSSSSSGSSTPGARTSAAARSTSISSRTRPGRSRASATGPAWPRASRPSAACAARRERTGRAW